MAIEKTIIATLCLFFLTGAYATGNFSVQKVDGDIAISAAMQIDDLWTIVVFDAPRQQKIVFNSDTNSIKNGIKLISFDSQTCTAKIFCSRGEILIGLANPAQKLELDEEFHQEDSEYYESLMDSCAEEQGRISPRRKSALWRRVK